MELRSLCPKVRLKLKSGDKKLTVYYQSHKCSVFATAEVSKMAFGLWSW